MAGASESDDIEEKSALPCFHSLSNTLEASSGRMSNCSAEGRSCGAGFIMNAISVSLAQTTQTAAHQNEVKTQIFTSRLSRSQL